MLGHRRRDKVLFSATGGGTRFWARPPEAGQGPGPGHRRRGRCVPAGRVFGWALSLWAQPSSRACRSVRLPGSGRRPTGRHGTNVSFELELAARRTSRMSSRPQACGQAPAACLPAHSGPVIGSDLQACPLLRIRVSLSVPREPRPRGMRTTLAASSKHVPTEVHGPLHGNILVLGASWDLCIIPPLHNASPPQRQECHLCDCAGGRVTIRSSSSWPDC